MILTAAWGSVCHFPRHVGDVVEFQNGASLDDTKDALFELAPDPSQQTGPVRGPTAGVPFVDNVVADLQHVFSSSNPLDANQQKRPKTKLSYNHLVLFWLFWLFSLPWLPWLLLWLLWLCVVVLYRYCRYLDTTLSARLITFPF